MQGGPQTIQLSLDSNRLQPPSNTRRNTHMHSQKRTQLARARPLLQGGPQMIQLSLDGKRLYVTNSLLSPWDKQVR